MTRLRAVTHFGVQARASILEYVEAVQGRYLKGSKKEKGKILDEFTKVAGCHRKAAIRLIHRGNQSQTSKRHGRRRQYDTTVAGALRLVWEATDRLCSKRLHPFLPELVTILRRLGESTLNADIESCHVEQKNCSVVRRLIGYDRYNSKAALEALNRIYYLTRLHVNFFQPVMKLVKKTRHGAKVYKVYDTAQTPYQRLIKTGVLSETKRQELAATYHYLNLVTILKQINENLERLWEMAEYPPRQQMRDKTHEVMVT